MHYAWWQAVYEQARRVYVLRVKASTAIQRCYRGHLTRAVLAQARSWARRQVLMAIRIQVSAREGGGQMREASKHQPLTTFDNL